MGPDYQIVEYSAFARSWHKCGLRYLMTCSRGQNDQCQAESNTSQGETVFPEPWQSIWLDRQRLQIHMLWTYFELGQDLMLPDKSRKYVELFSRILAHLDLPSEKIVLWPLTEYQGSSLVPRQDYFWQGVDLFRPLYTVIFGQEAMQLICPELTAKYGSYYYDRVQMVYLPGPSDMLPDNRQAKGFVWQMLLQLQQEIMRT